jgi:hypothetical protein
MAKQSERLLEEGIWEIPSGYIARVSVGSGDDRLRWSERYPPGTARSEIRVAKAKAYAALLAEAELEGGPQFAEGRCRHLPPCWRYHAGDTNPAHAASCGGGARTPPKRGRSPVTRDRDQRSSAEKNGEDVPDRGVRLGDLPRLKLDPARLREVLAKGFAATDKDKDPYEFASTSNNYRTALMHVYSELDQDHPERKNLNPLLGVKVRATRAAQPKGQDARVVAAILKNMTTKYGRKTKKSDLICEVLAWVHHPGPVEKVKPEHFHDVADATDDEIVDGIITRPNSPAEGRRTSRCPRRKQSR